MCLNQKKCVVVPAGDIASFRTFLDTTPWAGMKVEPGAKYLGFNVGPRLKPGEMMNHKIPPKFDGAQPWWGYLQLVRDWQETTSLEKKQQGPMLRNRFVGQASVYKRALKRATLASDEGVAYFRHTLKTTLHSRCSKFFFNMCGDYSSS